MVLSPKQLDLGFQWYPVPSVWFGFTMVLISPKHLVWVYCGAQFQTFGLDIFWCSAPNIWIELTVVLSSKHLFWVYNGTQSQTFILHL